MGGASFRAPLACANGVVIRVSLHGPRLMSEVVGDIQAMTATALHILPNTSSGGGDHTSNVLRSWRCRCESNRGSGKRALLARVMRERERRTAAVGGFPRLTPHAKRPTMNKPLSRETTRGRPHSRALALRHGRREATQARGVGLCFLSEGLRRLEEARNLAKLAAAYRRG
jgi:hypothetical protein